MWCCLQVRPCGWDWALHTCLDPLPVRVLAHLYSLQASLALTGWWRMGCQCVLDRHPAREICCRWVASSATGKVQIYHVGGHTATSGFWQHWVRTRVKSNKKKEASGERLKLWQPGVCSSNFRPNFWLMLDVWTWAMQLAPCCLNQLGWMIELWLDLPESRCEVWSDLSRINKNEFARCLQTQRISVSLC